MLSGVHSEPDLTGIARLAAESDLLEARRVVRYFEIDTRSALNRVRSGMPFTYSLNPYRGCEFGCKYCYARYTHEFMELRESEDFENKIYAKRNLVPILAGELRKVRPGEIIAIGTATDPYQPAERRFGRTRAILEMLAGHRGLSVSVTTKSDLIRRDVALLAKVAEHNTVTVNMTITTLDVSLARELEPKAPRPDLRLRAVRDLADGGIHVGVFPNPIMPLITDQEARLNGLAKAAREHGARYFGGGPLFLTASTQRVFFPFVAKRYPQLLRRYRERYENDAYLKGPYLDMLRARLARVRAAHGLAAAPTMRQQPTDEAQGRLF